MKKLISISEFGSISVLGVPLGSTTSYIKEVFSKYEINENNNCLYLNMPATGNTPMLSVVFGKKDTDIVDKISIRNTHLTQDECDRVYNFFKNEFSSLKLISEDKTDDTVTLVLSNTLHRVKLFKQKGLEDNENLCPFIMDIQGTLFNSNDSEREKAIREIYHIQEVSMRKNKQFSNIQIDKTMKALFVVIALIIMYLFALNGRYSKIEYNVYFDKWKCCIIEAN